MDNEESSAPSAAVYETHGTRWTKRVNAHQIWIIFELNAVENEKKL